MEGRPPSREEVHAAIRALIDEYRARCLWFAPVDYQPEDDKGRLKALEAIQLHGGHHGFVRAGELKQWLLHDSNENSSIS